MRGLLDLPEAIARLRHTNFRIHPTVLDDVLARDAERKHQQSESQEGEAHIRSRLKPHHIAITPWVGTAEQGS